jgi:hypothetical protein
VLNCNQMRSVTVVTLLAGAMACGDSGPEVAPSQTRISIADDIAAQSAAPLIYASVNGVLFAVDPATVTSLEITVTDVLYLQVGDDENTESAWQPLGLGSPITIDLMALPAESEGEIILGAGTVAVGTYNKVRLLVSGGEITFNTAIAIGGGEELAAGSYDVMVPSGAESGIKSTVFFEVTEGEGGEANAARLVFEPGTTFLNVTVTGNGEVILNPVLRAK